MKKEEKTVPEETENVTETAAEELPVVEDTQPAEDMKRRLEQAEAEAADNKRKWYAVTAEYENYRKRTAATRTQAYAEGRADVVTKLFPIADNLDRAMASCSDESTRKGIGMVIKAFEKLLEEEKIECIAPLGEEFDAEKCEAIMAVDPAEGEASGIVREVYLKGYEQNGKVLRFAQVVVTK